MLLHLLHETYFRKKKKNMAQFKKRKENKCGCFTYLLSAIMIFSLIWGAISHIRPIISKYLPLFLLACLLLWLIIKAIFSTGSNSDFREEGSNLKHEKTDMQELMCDAKIHNAELQKQDKQDNYKQYLELHDDWNRH